MDGLEETHWFRLVDAIKGVVWMHQIPNQFDYHVDKPFFHMFSGKVRLQSLPISPRHLSHVPKQSRMFGFRFDEDADAGTFLQRVTSEVAVNSASMIAITFIASSLTMSCAGTPSKPKRERLPKRLLTSMISRPAPGTFVHVAHVGIDADGNNEASGNISPEWIVAFEQLQGGPMHPPSGTAKPVHLNGTDTTSSASSSPSTALHGSKTTSRGNS